VRNIESWAAIILQNIVKKIVGGLFYEWIEFIARPLQLLHWDGGPGQADFHNYWLACANQNIKFMHNDEWLIIVHQYNLKCYWLFTLKSSYNITHMESDIQAKHIKTMEYSTATLLWKAAIIVPGHIHILYRLMKMVECPFGKNFNRLKTLHNKISEISTQCLHTTKHSYSVIIKVTVKVLLKP